MTDEAQRDLEHIGFRVSGIKRDLGRMEDLFELRNSAIECAQILDSEGWINVRCQRVWKADVGTSFEREETENLDWKTR